MSPTEYKCDMKNEELPSHDSKMIIDLNAKVELIASTEMFIKEFVNFQLQ